MKNGKNYLLAIAIDNYQHYNKLNNAVKDVKDIINILTNLYQFDEEDVFTLFNEDATEDRIDEEFLELIDRVTEQDNLIIFYSGHGYYRKNVREGYWIPVDGRKDKVSDYISNANLIQYLYNINAHHVLMIVDSCFSGALVEQLRGDANSERFPSRRVLASGRAEMVSDGIPGENSPFAVGVIDFLKANKEKQVSTTDLIASVKNYVGRVSNQDPIEGRLRKSRDNKGEFFFKRKLSERHFWQKILEKDTIEAYEEYLEIYPSGQYAAMARNKMQKLKAFLAWQRAEAGGTIDDYNNFIIAYSGSEYVEAAKDKLITLRKAAQERKRILEALAQEQEEIDKHRKMYLHLVREGDKAMRNHDYRMARDKYYECVSYYMEGKEGFIPDFKEVQQRRNVCTAEINFLLYKEESKKAYKTKDFGSAIELAKKALEIKPDDELKKLLELAGIWLNANIEPIKSPPTPAPIGNKPSIKIIQAYKTPGTHGKPTGYNHSIGINRGSESGQIIYPGSQGDAKQEGADRKTKRDFIYLWIVLLVIGYLISCYLIGVF